MNKVLVTGQGVGRDFGVCSTCNLNFTWLLMNPSILVWAEKIVVTKSSWESQIRHSKTKFNKALNLVLQIANDNNIIEILDVKEMFNDRISNEIIKESTYDIENILNNFPESVKKGTDKIPGQVIINDIEYCAPYLSSIYASMKLGEAIDANCLFSKRDYNYLKYKYGVDNRISTQADKIEVLNEIFDIYIPNELVLHNFAIEPDEKCNTCAKNKECKDNYLNEVENNTYKIIKWRQYDEIFRAKEEVEKIINMKQQFGKQINPKDIQNEFRDKQNNINKNIRRIFPVIKRWSNLTTVVATPISIYSAATANKNIMIASTAMLGAAKALDEGMKYYENKNNWVGFINKQLV